MAFIHDFFIGIISFFTASLIFLGFIPSPVIVDEQPLQVEVEQEVTLETENQGIEEMPAKDIVIEETPTPPQIAPAAKPPKIVTPVVRDPLEDVIAAFSNLTPPPEPVTPFTPPQSVLSLNETVRNSVVNILCTTEGGGQLNPISASGVIIHPLGVILTNSHVAQYLLLKDHPTTNFIKCVARTGSPASPKYTLELLFAPPSWIQDNASKIVEQTPRGNGEHDYALLRITGGVSSSINVPAVFPALSVALDTPSANSPVLLAGYPAGFLGGITVQKELYAVSANSVIGELFTFGGNTADLFSIGSSVVAQQGSSGGAVAREDGALVGLIVTSSEGDTTGERDLRAIATSYIIRDFEKQSGESLESYLSGNLSDKARIFNLTTAPNLTKTLLQFLQN